MKMTITLNTDTNKVKMEQKDGKRILMRTETKVEPDSIEIHRDDDRRKVEAILIQYKTKADRGKFDI